MITKDGENYLTIQDAAKALSVSAKTVRTWIKKRIIDTPPWIYYGTRTLDVFPQVYLRKAKLALAKHRRSISIRRHRRGASQLRRAHLRGRP